MTAPRESRPWSLVVGAGEAQAPFLEAWSRSYRVLATDRNPEAGGRRFAERFAALDARDDAAISEFALEALAGDSLAHAISFGSGEPQRAAARIAERLGVPGPPAVLVERALSKRRLLDWLAGLGLSPPKAYHAETPRAAREFLQHASGRWYLVPDRGGSGHGVARLEAGACTDASVEEVFELGGAGGVMLTPEVRGAEFVVSVVVRAGRLAFVSVGRSIRLASSLVVPIGQVFGAEPPGAIGAEELEDVAARVVRASGLQRGILGFESVRGPDGSAVLDLDLGFGVPVRLARELPGATIADYLVDDRPLGRASELSCACGLMYAVVSERKTPPALVDAQLRAWSAAYGAEFRVAPDGGSRFRAPGASYRRVGHWLVKGADQAQVARRLDAIARRTYGCGLR